MAILTFLDSSVLIAAHRGETAIRAAAWTLLIDPNRAFVASPFLYLELMPKPVYFKNDAEAQFYLTYFDSVRIWVNDCNEIVELAREEAERCGLSALDALHISAAKIAEAPVLITLEKKHRALHQSALIRVESLTG